MVTTHAMDRALGRLTEVGIDGMAVLARAQRVAVKVPVESAAILMVEMRQREFCSDGSNGDQVWAVVRNRRVVTLMLRRSTQPATTGALGVDQVYRVGSPAAGGSR